MALALISYLVGYFLAKWQDSRIEYVNLPQIANEVCLKEGKKHSVNIADTKEIMHVFMHRLSRLNKRQINYIVKAYER